MTGSTRIVSLGGEPQTSPEDLASTHDLPADAPPLLLEDEWAEPETEAPRPDRLPAIAGGLAIVLVICWSGLFAWTLRDALTTGSTPADWVNWIGQWSVPPLLVCVLWLMAMRHSTREADRFGHAARQLRDESTRLEERLTAVNRELSLAREFIAAQSRDLETLGRLAVERIGGNAERLADLVSDNGARIDTIASVSSAALENMEKLRSQLPVIANSAKDATNNIANAGLTAHAQLQDMVNGFTRLNEFGQASERQVIKLREIVDNAIREFTAHVEHLGTTSEQRYAALIGQGEEFRSRLDRQEAEALASIQTRSTALASELDALRSTLEAQESESLGRLDARLASLREQGTSLAEQAERLDTGITQRQSSQESHLRELAASSQAMADRLAELTAQMHEIAAHGGEAERRIAASLSTLATKLEASREALSGTGGTIDALTDSSVRLLELIRASVTHSSEDLPTAMKASEERLAELEKRSLLLRDTVSEAQRRGEALSNNVISTRQDLGEAIGTLDALYASLGEHAQGQQTEISRLRGMLSEIEKQSATLAATAQDQLTAAIERLAGSARSAVAAIETENADAISALAQRVAEESGVAIDKALQARTAEAVAQLEQASAHAAGVSRDSAIQLRDQLAKVNELTANLEKRIAQARERAEERVDNDFARRVALITESLNSHAIDISKALSSEVTDPAWAAYLRGDRGVFTRRAVRLLDSSEARSIAQAYDTDPELREHVNRYIHDFEGMLRQLLSTRDGHALGVTLLSSDMGKLYVALAQGIERLRS